MDIVQMHQNLVLPRNNLKVSFKEYLAIAKQYPALSESSKGRLFRLIARKGINELRTNEIRRKFNNETIAAWEAYAQFFGIERSIDKMVTNYLYPALEGGECDKQCIYWVGPPGSAKSALMVHTGQLYRTAEPFPYVQGSRVFDNPLSLFYMIPLVAAQQADEEGADDYESRAQEIAVSIMQSLALDTLIDFRNARLLNVLNGADNNLSGIAMLPPEQLVSALVYGLGLPPSTRAAVGPPEPMIQALAKGHFINPGKPIALADFQIRSQRFTDDFHGSIGSVDVAEVNETNFDISQWIGEENLGMLGRLQAGDPRMVNLNGAFCLGNRGRVVLTEDCKNPVQAHRVKLELLQGRRLPLPRPLTGSLFIDTLVFAHTNEPEFEKFISADDKKAYQDRFFEVKVPYTTEVSQAKRVILESFWNKTGFSKSVEEGGVHHDPLMIDMAALFEVITRMEPHGEISLIDKARAYDGEDVRIPGSGTRIIGTELRQAATPREGMFGRGDREIAKVMQAIASERIGRGNCITYPMFFQRLHEWIKDTVRDKEEAKKLTGFISVQIDEEYRRRAQEILTKSLLEGFPAESQELFDKYKDSVEAFLGNERVERPGGYVITPRGGDKKVLDTIEGHLGLNAVEAVKFRGGFQRAITKYLEKHGREAKIPYTCHPEVQKAVEKEILIKVGPISRIYSSLAGRSKEDRDKLSTAKTRLIEMFGFCQFCADDFLRRAEETQGFTIKK